MAKKRVKKSSGKKRVFKSKDVNLPKIEHHHYLMFFVLFLVLIAVVYMFGAGVFGNKPWYEDYSLEEVASSCELAAKNNLKANYCNTFREVKIGERDQYANCHYLKQKGYAEFENYGLICDNEGVFIKQLAVTFCINKDLGNREAVNGYRCDSIAECEVPESQLTKPKNAYLNGVRRLEIEGCQNGEIDLTEYAKDSADGIICCVDKAKAGITGNMIMGLFI